MRAVFIVCFGLVLLQAGCKQYEKKIPEEIQGLSDVIDISEQVPEYDLSFTFKEIYGDNKDIIIASLQDFEVTDDGRVIIADYTTKTLHVYSDANTYLGSLGREGLGPGELKGITDMYVKGDELHVYDRFRFMIHVFDLNAYSYLYSDDLRQFPQNQDEYEEIKTWRPLRYQPLYNGKALSGFMKYPPDARRNKETFNIGQERLIKYYPVQYEGEVLAEKFFELRDYEDLSVMLKGKLKHNVQPLPYLGQSIVKPDSNGKIYTAWTKEFLIRQYEADGTYIRSFYHPDFPKKSLKREMLKQIVPEDTWNRPIIEHADLPDYWPAIYTIEPDDKDRLWIAAIQKDSPTITIRVISDSGNLLGAGLLPHDSPHNFFRRRNPVIKIKGDYLYITDQDVTTGESLINKYRVTFR